MSRVLLPLAALGALTCSAFAQQGSTSSEARTCVVAAGTAISIRVAVDLHSQQVKRGDKFPILLAEPVIAGGAIVMAPGTMGEGEVVHAKKIKGDQPGELILAARHLVAGPVRVPLRGFRISGAGEVERDGYYTRTYEVLVPAGTRAGARIAADTALPCPPSLG